MKITKNVVPSIAYQVRTQDGVLVDEAPVNQPLEYLHGHHNLVVGLENALEGKEVGDVFEVRVEPEEGYGQYQDSMVQRVPKEVFMGVDELEVGMRFIADTDIGPLPVVITAVEGDEVVVDGNHMLAGQALLFSVEVVSIREATLEEIAHGHIHGEHGGCCGGHDSDEDGHSCGCGHHHHEHDGECCDEHHHHHHDGKCCHEPHHHHHQANEECCETSGECCDEHHHHHHDGKCCHEPHHHHHQANEECCETAGECCEEHHHHHHDGKCCHEPHHHHHQANEECCETAGECCEEHHHHHHNGVCCDEPHHHHHTNDESCAKH